MSKIQYKGTTYVEAINKCEDCGEDIEGEGTLCKKCRDVDEKESHEHLYRGKGKGKKGQVGVEAGQALKTYYVTIHGVDLFATVTSLSAALATFRSLLRPSKDITSQTLKPKLLPTSKASRLKSLLQQQEESTEDSNSAPTPAAA